MREFILQPRGVITQPNPYGQFPPGAMSVAENVVMRSPGVLDQAPGLGTQQNVGSSGDVIHDILPIEGGAVISRARSSGGSWTVRRNGDAYLPPSGVGNPTYSQTGRCATVESNGRVFLNSEAHGVLVIDDPSVSPGGTARLREAGLPQGALVSVSHSIADPIAFKQDDVVGYACIYHRVYADGYELVGPPSPIFIFLCPVASANAEISIYTRADMYLQPGDFVEVYRTNVIPNGSATTDPGTDLKRVIKYEITSADISTGFVNLIDKTQPGPLNVTAGQALYTNPGQPRGILAAHFAPPVAKCMAMFKNYLFFGNVTEKAKLKFRVPAGIAGSTVLGFTTAAWRAKGIGHRSVAGTATIGSPTITGVSTADLVGIKPGQRYAGGGAFSLTARVQSVGGTSITMTQNATAGGASHVLMDTIVVNNVSTEIASSPRTWLNVFQSDTTGHYILTSSEALVSGQDPANGIRNIEYTIQYQRWGDGAPPNVLAVRATNGANYDPPLPEYTDPDLVIQPETYTNVLQYSNDSQPEHRPVTNEVACGTEEIVGLASTRDALWVFASDGLWRLSGAGGSWRIDIADTTLRLCAPRAFCVLRESVYAYTNVGLVRITDAGVERLSSQLVSDSLLPEVEYTETADIIVSYNEPTDEIVVRRGAADVVVYNVRSGGFTTVAFTFITAMAYARYPASGAPALMFAKERIGLSPVYAPWNGGSGSALAPTVRFQPIYAQDPFALKQWVEASYIFKATNNRAITPTWNGVANVASVTARINGQFTGLGESRARTGVPRRFAIGHSISPGYTQTAGSPNQSLLGLSLRFKLLGEQSARRGVT